MSWLDTLEDIRKKDFSQSSEADRDKAARDVVNMTSYGCAVIAVSPMPFSDALLMLPIQSGMVMTVGHIYGRKVTKAAASELIVELGTAAGASILARQGIKALLPVVGALLTIPAAFAANWAIGRVAIEYFKNPGMTKEQMRKVYAAAKSEGSKLFSRDAFARFRKEKPAEAESAAPKKKRAPAKKKKRASKAKSSPESGPAEGQ